MSADAASHTSSHTKKPKAQHKKLKPLPSNFKISKRPLHRPAIPSKYSSTDQQKVVYISTKTPFLSAVKRTEKLVQLAEKRLEQSATTVTKNNKNRKRQRAAGEEDEILEIAKTVEAEKKRRKVAGDASGEEVVLKGTGKAVQKVLELGLFFQQREEYNVRLKTGSASAIDDITADEDVEDEDKEADAVGGAEREDDSAITDVAANASRKTKSQKAEDSEPPPETRIRYTSVLEVYVSLK